MSSDKRAGDNRQSPEHAEFLKIEEEAEEQGRIAEEELSALRHLTNCRNRWYKIPFMLVVTFIMMQPAVVADWFGVGNKYLIYIAGLVIAGLIFLNQKRRKPAH